jgi:hypothetical protein
MRLKAVRISTAAVRIRTTVLVPLSTSIILKTVIARICNQEAGKIDETVEKVRIIKQLRQGEGCGSGPACAAMKGF